MFGLTLAPARDGVLLLTDGDPASLAQYLNSRRFRRQALAAVLPDARVLIAPHLVLGAGTRDALGEAREDWPGQDTGVPNRAFGAEIGFLRGMRRKARTRGDSGAVGAGWQCREAPTREDDCGEFPARDTSSGVGWAPGTDPRFAGGTGEQDGAATQRLGGSLDTARADSTGTRHARSVPAGVDEQRGPEVQQVGNRTAGGSARPGNRPRYALTAEHPGHAWRGLALYPFDAAADRPLPRRLEAAGYREIDSAAVDALRVAAWRPLASLEAADGRTLPHELDWLRTTTPLNSGCYPGQETVAKIVNVGKPPRRLVFLHLDGSEAVLPEVGAPVWAAPHGAGAEVGRVTSVAMHFEDGPIALALVKRQVSADAVLLVTADAPGGAITASQVPIVPPSGESDSRPALRAAPRGLGLRRPRRG
jgi:folate-binding protein YgfZ